MSGNKRKRRGHGEGSVFESKDGRWCAAVTVGRDATGRLKRRYIYGETRREVQAQLTRLLADAQKGLPLDLTRQTSGEFLSQWLEDSFRGNVRPATYESYSGALKHALPAVGSIPLAK